MSWSSQWSLSFWLSHQYPICIPRLPHSLQKTVTILSSLSDCLVCKLEKFSNHNGD
jgi:hypothetical protein